MQTQKNFIVIDGGDGAGKSTVITNLQKAFGKKILFTKNPYEYQKVIDFCNNHDGDGLTQQKFHLKDKKLFEKEVLLPNSGKTIVCDRGFSSSIAYGVAAGMNYAEIVEMQRELNIFPQNMIYLDLDPQIAKQRRKNDQSGQTLDKFDQKDLEFHQKLRETYQKMVCEKLFDLDWHLIDANRTPEEVFTEVHAIIQKASA